MLTSISHPTPSHARIQCLMHSLPAELMLRLLVLLVVRPSESSLVIQVLIYARCIGLPIFNVESAQEASILVCKLFHRVWGVLNSPLSVLDHLVSAHVWNGNIVVSTVSACASITPTVSTFVASLATTPASLGTQTTTIPSTMLLLVVLLVLQILLLLPVWLGLLHGLHVCLILW